jgi:hypothetical protein
MFCSPPAIRTFTPSRDQLVICGQYSLPTILDKVFDHVDGVRLCLRTAATNGPIVHLPGGTILTGENPKNWEKALY